MKKGIIVLPTLRNGELIPILNSNEKARILNYIAEGGQGEVYRVLYNNQEYALKWYSKIPMSDAFYNNLAHNVKMGKPNDNFLWAVALTQKIKNKFGYIMPLRPSNYREYGEFLLGDVRFKSWDMLFKAALNLADSFRILHSRGYSYQDLNEGSFFIDPDCYTFQTVLYRPSIRGTVYNKISSYRPNGSKTFRCKSHICL